MKFLFLIIFATGFSKGVFGQAPVIQNVAPINAAPNDTLLITGSGFDNNLTNNEVWFDQVKGTVSSASEFALEVKVPPQSRLSVIEVLNRGTRLSAKAPLKFMPSLRTESFNVAKFAAPVSFPATEELWDLCTCDLNADGKPDLATTKFTSGSAFTPSTDIMLLQNNSTPGNLNAASFQKFDKTNLPVLNLTFGTDHIVCGDLQGDGYPELVVSRAGSTRNSIHIFRNTSVGTTLNLALVSTPPLLLDVGHFATRMNLRDLNRDGKPEIIVTNSFNDLLYIFVNQSSAGTLSFNPAPIKLSIKIGATDVLTTYETEVQDLNGDNLPDIIINQFQTSNLYILRNQSSGAVSFAAPQKITLPGELNRLTSGDFNKDGKLDLVVTSTLSNQVDILLNQTAENATSFSFAPSLTMITSTGPWGVDVSDIDGDNDPDITIANRGQNTINVFLHNGNFTTPGFAKVDITTTLPTRNLKTGDLDGDGKPDIAYTAFNSIANTTQVGILRNTNCHKPFIENIEPLVICNGQTIQLKTAPANNVSFLWTKDGAPAVGTSHFLNITTPGSYQVTATGEGGLCVISSNTVIVTADLNNAPANPVITANSPLCIGATLNLQTGTVASATYTWTGPNGFTSSLKDPSILAVTDAEAGIYALQIKIGVCKSEVVTKRVDVARLADFTITSSSASNTICSGSNVLLSVNNQANHTYQWRKDGVDIALQTTTSLTASQSGTYTVKVTNTTLNCDMVTDGITLTVMQAPVANFTTQISGCTNEDHIFTNQSQTDTRATVLNNWNFGDGVSVTTVNATHRYTTAQTFNASLTVGYQGVSGCSNTLTKAISIVSGVLPLISSSAASSCPDVEVTLSITGTYNSALWSNSVSGNFNTVIPGTYSVSTIDANGCKGRDEITIGKKSVPVIIASATPPIIPEGATSQLNATGGVSYIWSPVETLNDPAIANPIASPLQTTTYTVIARSAENCKSEAQVLVTVEGVLTFPVAFSPNGDGFNDLWNIRAETNPDCTLTIFDGRGRRIFENRGENWDGTYQGKAVPDGTYYYVYGCPDEKPLTGSILVFK